MKKPILRNKKGFTLIELIATVAIMAILAGAVTPAVYYSTQRRQKSAAEYDTQTMYRNSIAAITYLAGQNITPEKPVPRGEAEPTNKNWYVTFSMKVAKRLYDTVIALDIPVKYFDGDSLKVPKKADETDYTASERSTFVTAGNKNPYIVVQVIRDSSDDMNYNNYLIISYHNDKNQFQAKNWAELGTQFNAYTTNANNPIVYTYKIRKA